MFGLMGALLNVLASSIGKLGVPDKVLSAVQTTPVPVGTHDSADEVGIVLVGGVVVNEIAPLDFVRGGCHCHGSRKGDQGGDNSHDAGLGRECRGVSRGSRRSGQVGRNEWPMNSSVE